MKFTAQPAYAELVDLLTAAGCDGTASAGVGKPDEFPVEFALIGVGAEISKVIDRRLGAGTVDHIVASETVGAKVGSQLKRDGVQAMLFAIGFIFLFVMIRFDLRFAPGGIVALAHDALIVVGAFAITGKDSTSSRSPRCLTIIGYSINDTIVVFDRIRERVALHRDAPIQETTNTALNETLSRTILTSTTTLMVVIATWVLGERPDQGLRVRADRRPRGRDLLVAVRGLARVLVDQRQDVQGQGPPDHGRRRRRARRWHALGSGRG